MLLAEDNEADALLISEALIAAGLECNLHVAEDGEQALNLLAQADTLLPKLALVILDLNLPRYSGLEILVSLGEKPELEHVPVVVMSGSLNPRHRDEAFARGARLFIAKSSDIDDFFAAGVRLKELVEQQD